MAGTEVYFYTKASPFSNFHPVPGGFEHKGTTLRTSEHHLMLQKALLMGDDARALEIMSASSALGAKRLGRKVKPWDQARWEASCEDLMTGILVSKFSHPAMKDKLLDTGDSPLCEASPRDKIWGIGISVAAAERGEPHRGRNLLGQCLVRAREKLRGA